MVLHWWPGSNLVDGLIYDGVWFSAIALVLGTVPAALVMLLTAARLNPWGALRTLVIGSVLGFIPVAPLLEKSSSNYVILVAVILGPTIGGVIASRFLLREPHRAN